MIEEAYVSFEVAKLLKEKGFDVPCNCLWNNPPNGSPYNSICEGIMTYEDIDPEVVHHWYLYPTQQMAMRWLREVHNIGIFPSTYTHIVDRKTIHSYGTAIINLKTYELMTDNYLSNDTYEGAVEVAINYCLKNLI